MKEKEEVISKFKQQYEEKITTRNNVIIKENEELNEKLQSLEKISLP